MEGWLLDPFLEFGFMRRALAGCFALALGAAPVGVFLMLRNMSLAGDAIAHAILPGAAIGYMLAGLSLPAMTGGGLVAGLIVALVAGGVARVTQLREDASLSAVYLISLAAGVMIISLSGNGVDLMNVLFGNVLALDDPTLLLLAGIASLTVVALAVGYRALVLECVDPAFLRSVSRASPVAHLGFLVLLVLNLVAGFHALGTLMAVGMMILPAATARLWQRDLGPLLASAVAVSLVGATGGLLLSYHAGLPSGPAIVLSLGALYVLSLLASPVSGLFRRLRPRWHYTS
ncbi:MAG: metal ABC transporter permease [Rhodocyclaceae bacterium]|nr:metal ABC transporter permease [Rhodocyclaceae bacterium]